MVIDDPLQTPKKDMPVLDLDSQSTKSVPNNTFHSESWKI